MATGGLLPPLGHAQVTSTGFGTVVNQPSAGTFDITGGTRPDNGANLFHSFGDFSLDTGQSANFLNDSGLATTNILGRVTDGNPSNIFGTINTTDFTGANLYLMNPAGILFGPNAQINVDGSFHATTADYIRLGTAGGIVYADPGQASVLDVAAPSAFGFLSDNPGSIEVQTGGLDADFFPAALLQVPEGQTLSLVGGNAPGSDIPGVSIGALDGSTPGYVLAPAGRVNLVSVASAGEAVFDGTGFDVDGFSQLGTVMIGRGPDADIYNEGASIVDGKEIFIRSGRLEIDNGVVVPGGFAFELSFVGLSPLPDGGEVNIKVTDDVTITGTDFDGLTFAPPGIFVYEGDFYDVSPEAKVPDVTIDAGSVSISGFAGIQTNRNGPGEPGNVVINTDTLTISSGGTVVLFNAFAGPGGNLIVNANDVAISGDGSDSPVGFEGLGAQGVVSFAYLFPYTDPELITGDSGNITVNANNTLNVSGSGQITTDSRVLGGAGAITLNAGDIFLSGNGEFESGVIASQSSFAGDAEDVTINAARSITIEDGFRISSTALGSGDAGNVDVTAGESITLSNNGRILGRTNQAPDSALNGLFDEVFLQEFDSLREEMGKPDATLMEVLGYLQERGDIEVPDLDLIPGDAGTVSVTTPILTLKSDASIQTSTGWEGSAGQIIADVDSLSVNSGSFISSSSGIVLREPDGTIIGPAVGPGDAGSVNLTSTGSILISGRSATSGAGSTISTSTFGDGNGGNINLTADEVVVSDGGSITAETGGILAGSFFADTGGAGSIAITTASTVDAITVSGKDSTISTATYGDGAGGDIELNANRIEVLAGGSVTAQTGGTLEGSLFAGGGAGGSVTFNAADAVSISQTGSTVSATTSGAGQGGDVELTGNEVEVAGGGSVTAEASAAGSAGTIGIAAADLLSVSGAKSTVSTTTSGAGTGGSVRLTGNQVQVTGGGSVTAEASSTGAAGAIHIAATGPLTVSGTDSTVSTATIGDGNGGTIDLTADEVVVSDGGRITAETGGVIGGELFAGNGNAGDIAITTAGTTNAITVSDAGSTISTATYGDGAGGGIELNANRIAVFAGGSVTAQTGGTLEGSLFAGAGAGGSVTLNGGEAISISGSGSTVSATTSGAGQGGDIGLTGNEVDVAGGASVTAEASGAGNAGTIDVAAADLLAVSGTGSTVSTTSTGTGAGGSITLTSDNDVQILDGGSATADSFGTGLTGNIIVTAGHSVVMDDGSISTRAVTSDGGNIQLTATDRLYMDHGEITTSVESGVGGGGNINIDPDFVLMKSGRILANAYGGPGGNINIVAGNFIATPDSLVDASSALGIDGTVNISSPDQDVSEDLAVLPDTYLDVTRLISDRCGTTAGASSLVDAGPGGLTVDPDGYLPSFVTEAKPEDGGGGRSTSVGSGPRWWAPYVHQSALDVAGIACDPDRSLQEDDRHHESPGRGRTGGVSR